MQNFAKGWDIGCVNLDAGTRNLRPWLVALLRLKLRLMVDSNLSF